MSEMSAEKKKEIEKYIIKSYFGGGKNIEAYVNGADLISGFGDVPDLLVEVESFNDEMITVRWNILSEFGSEYKNEFMMVLTRKREIERNRCDSVDSIVYAWEAWKSRILNKPVFLKTNDEDLQKDKRIEELEREVKALKAEKEVMERHIQELESRNVSLAETEKNKTCIEFSMRSMMATHRPYQDDTDIAITGMAPGKSLLANNPFDIPCDVVVIPKRDFDRLQTENEQLKTKLQEYDPLPDFRELLKKLYSTNDIEKLEWTLNHVCGGRGSVNGWIAVSLFWKQKYEALSKLVGFVTVEEIQDYLTNEAECDTLHETLLKLIDENKYACEQWYGANSENNSWKAAAKCNSPKELIEKREALDKEIGVYSRALKEWKEITGCPSPSAAKTLIDSMYTPLKESYLAMKKDLDQEIVTWQKATCCDSPEEANKKLKSYENRLDSVKQSASIAIRHLDNIVFRDDKRTDWSDK